MAEEQNPLGGTKLPESEEAVLLALWECGGKAGFYQLQQQLDGRRWAPSTLLNFLYRLEKRGLVAVEKQGGRNRYRALARRQDYLAAQSRQFLARYWQGSPTALVQGLINARLLADEELEAIRLLADQELTARYSGENDLYDPWEG